MTRGSAWAIALVALGAMSLLVTRDGVGIDADSAVYLGTAQNVIDGRGVTVPFTLFTDEYDPIDAVELHGRVPLTHYPPLYPLVVAGFALPTRDVEAAARLVGAAVFALNVALMWLLAGRAISNVGLRICAVALAAIGPVFGEVLPGAPDRTWLWQHSQAMSEGVYTALGLAALVALLRFDREQKRGALGMVVVVVALAMMTRYSGVALVGVASLTMLGVRRTQLPVRGAAAAGLVAVLAVAPVMLWVIGQQVIGGASLPRSLHWPTTAPSGLASVFEGWLGLQSWSPDLRHATLAALVVTVAWLVVRTGAPSLRIIGLYLLAYTLVVVLTRATLDASTPVDDRMFSPLQGPFYVVVIGALHTGLGPIARRSGVAARPVLRGIGLGLPLGLLASALPDASRLVGNGLSEREGPPETVLAADSLPDDAIVATNVPSQLWQETRRPSILVPLRVRTTTNERRPAFDADVRELADIICARRGYIVLLGPEEGRFGVVRQAAEADFADLRSVRVHRRLSDGVIMAAGDCSHRAQRSSRPWSAAASPRTHQ